MTGGILPPSHVHVAAASEAGKPSAARNLRIWQMQPDWNSVRLAAQTGRDNLLKRPLRSGTVNMTVYCTACFMSEVTEILQAIERGDASSTDELLPLVYEELRRIAAAKLSHESPGMTLQTTALVHEAYLRLVGGETNVLDGDTDEVSGSDESAVGWDSRGHFFAAAAESMRRVLIENARRKKQLKRGGNLVRLEFDNVDPATDEEPVDLLELNEALSRLETHDPSKAKVVKLRYFAGLTIEQTARALGVSEPTVKRHWLYARAWLRREMREESS